MNLFLQILQSNNPHEYLQNLSKHNPQMANIYNMYNKFMASSPEEQEQIIQQLCREKGLNIDELKKQYQKITGGLKQ